MGKVENARCSEFSDDQLSEDIGGTRVLAVRKLENFPELPCPIDNQLYRMEHEV